MHPAIGWGVPRAHRDTQGWRLSLGIILPRVKMCRRSQATQANFQCHNDMGSLYTQETTTAQLKSHSSFPGCFVILTEERYFQEVRERGFVGNCFVLHKNCLCVSRGKVLQKTLKLCKILIAIILTVFRAFQATRILSCTSGTMQHATRMA